MKKYAEKFAGKEKSRTFATRLRKTRSSLTSLRKDNEVKLEEEIIVCNLRDNDRESNRRVVDCNFKATSK
ncbi:MAG: hypothetical protein IKC68_02805 [Bacteroidales bacterium]|nr:hypothetical protein [Bacteroidales bacterium]MBR2857306.1 hypothetical protein [Bacteroidales bacterium]